MNYIKRIPILSKKKPKGAREKPFRFLDLPRELRDQIYEHIWRKSHEERPCFVPFGNTLPKNPGAAIVLVNRQIYAESMVVLYRPSTFEVHLSYITPRLERCTGMSSLDFECALPFAWRVEFIQKVVLYIDLSWEETVTKTMRALKWSALSKMERLRNLRVVIMHGHAQTRRGRVGVDDIIPDLSTGKYIDDNGGTQDFRNMLYDLMANLPSTLTEVTFGGQPPKRTGTVYATSIDGRFLIRVVDEFEELGLWQSRNRPRLVDGSNFLQIYYPLARSEDIGYSGCYTSSK